MLENKGYTVTLANNARRRSLPWSERSSIVLMDVQMPEMDGFFEPPQAIRSGKKRRQVAQIVMP